MLNDTDFSFEDLMSDGPDGDDLRRSIAEAVAVGAVDSQLCFQVAERCHGVGREAMALEFIGMGLRGKLVPGGWTNLVKTCGINVLLSLQLTSSRDGGELGIERFCGDLDHGDDDRYTEAMEALIDGLARDVEAAGILLDQVGVRDNMPDSQSLVGLLLAASQFRGDLDRAHRFAGVLAEFQDLNSFSFRLLARFALLDGAYDRAEEICRAAIRQFGEGLFLLCQLAVSLFCQGRYAEGRQAMARSVNIIENLKKVVDRRDEIRTWSGQLEHAIVNRTVDGGDMANIGASIRYTRPDQVKKFYAAHRQECTEENAYRTVSGHTNHVMFGEVEKLLAANPNLRKVINYGTLCGVREFELSERYPDVVWAGYDISELATEWNREAYQRDNLLFESDFGSLLTELSGLPGDALLVHCRTLDIMLPEAVKHVYRACQEAGVKRIMTAEYFCRSMPTLLYPDFEANPVETVHWDGILVMHNYARLFPEIGYEITHTEFRPVPLLASASGEGMMLEQMIEIVHAELNVV